MSHGRWLVGIQYSIDKYGLLRSKNTPAQELGIGGLRLEGNPMCVVSEHHVIRLIELAPACRLGQRGRTPVYALSSMTPSGPPAGEVEPPETMGSTSLNPDSKD